MAGLTGGLLGKALREEFGSKAAWGHKEVGGLRSLRAPIYYPGMNGRQRAEHSFDEFIRDSYTDEAVDSVRQNPDILGDYDDLVNVGGQKRKDNLFDFTGSSNDIIDVLNADPMKPQFTEEAFRQAADTHGLARAKRDIVSNGRGNIVKNLKSQNLIS